MSQEIYDLFEQIAHMPFCAEELALCEEAVRLADNLGDEELGYIARRKLMDSAYGVGQSEKMLVAFTWCRDYADRKKDELSREEHEDLLWHQRWVVNAGRTFPQLPAERIDGLHQDYARRMRELGLSRHNEAFVGLLRAMHTGNAAAAEEQFELLRSTKRDSLSACDACEAETEAEYHLFVGDDEAALKQTQHILDTGLTCAHIPTNTHALALAPLMRLGRWDEAATHAAASRQNVSGDPDHLWAQARHLEYLALTNTSAALKWYAHHVAWAEQTREMSVRMQFHAAAAMLFTVLAQAGKQSVRLKLSPDVPNHQASGEYSVEERLQHHEAEARHIAGLFDTRNGTGQQTKEVEKILALTALAGQGAA